MIGDRQLATAMRPLLGQFGRPHGPLGWLAALMIPMAHRQYYSLTAGVLHLQPDDVLLDVACGSGEFLREQAAHVGRVVGLDASSIEVRLARRRLSDRIRAGTAEVLEGDAADLPLDDAQFTAVNCVGSFLAFADRARALAEMHRVLRPGGRAAVCLEMHGEQGDADRHEAELMGVPLLTEADVRTLLHDAGFQDVAITYDNGAMIAMAIKAR